MNQEDKEIMENNIIKRVVAIIIPLVKIEIFNAKLSQKTDSIKEFNKEDDLKEKKKKTVEELVCYARYVFENASFEEKEMLEKVIIKFIKQKTA